VKKKRSAKRSVKKVRGNWFSDGFRDSLDYIKESKNYIWVATALFLASALIGFIYPGLFEDKIMALLIDLVEKTTGLSALELTGFIFWNNIQASLFGILFGVLLGVLPMIFSIVNGYVLGFVSNLSVGVAGPASLWRLFPHGIFELPAV